ncbi:MAG: hypothetical protein V4519_03135 [Patescibacteria group bacterium]
MLRDLIIGWYGETTYEVLRVIGYLYPLWFPPLLAWMFWEVWLRYIRYLFFANTKYVLLEIRLPKEITKSPVAMELVIQGLYQTGGESNFFAKYWEGKVRAWFSLELVSIGGEVHFYIWTRANMRNIVEAQVYAQYAEVEIREVEDYTRPVAYDPEKNEIWSCEYTLTNPDPLPIKTYIDYGLDRDPKEEHENNPLSTVVETLSSIKPTENIWVQFVIRAHKKEKRGGFLSKAQDWSGEVDSLRKRFFTSVKDEGRTTLTDEEKKLVDALHRSVQKYAFDTGIRALYIANKGAYDNTTVTSIRGLLRPFSTGYAGKLEEVELGKVQRHYSAFNSFKPNGAPDFDYPWEDYKDIRANYIRRNALDAYKRRMYFYAPYEMKSMVLTTEELATMFHFPGATVASPGLDRIQSKRAQAPTNLPT